jgi:hypothetical protein
MTFYIPDPVDPNQPVPLNEWHGLRPGMRVRHRDPRSGYRTPLVVSALLWAPDKPVTAVLEQEPWDVNVDCLEVVE